MNNFGKTTTIILVLVSFLLLSLLGISLFFYKQENDLRKSAESKLTQEKTLKVKLEADLKEAKKQATMYEEKTKEADEKINSLMDENELERGLKDQTKVENSALKDALTAESQAKEQARIDLAAAQDKITQLEAKLQETENMRADLERKVKDFETKAASPVQLEKIVVAPSEIPEGKVVSVNSENNFLIFNVGSDKGIMQDMTMSIYRGKKYLGDVKVTRAQEGMSAADFISPLTSKQVKKEDRVVVKQ